MKANLKTQGIIYFVHAPDVKRIKIGFTVNLEQRMRELQNDSPCELVLMNFVQGTYQTELALHAVFHQWRAQGEWFLASIPLLLFVRSLRKGRKFSSSQIALAK